MKILVQLVKKLDKIIELLTEEKEHREQLEAERQMKENEQRLMEYARKHNKRMPIGPHSTREMEDQPVQNARDAVPYNLSELDKDILRAWYDDSDNRRG